LLLREDDLLPMARAYQRQGTFVAGNRLPALLPSHARGPCTSTTPLPVGPSRAGRASWRTTACWPWASRRSASRAHGGDQPRGLQAGAGLPGGAGTSGAPHQRVLVLLRRASTLKAPVPEPFLPTLACPWDAMVARGAAFVDTRVHRSPSNRPSPATPRGLAGCNRPMATVPAVCPRLRLAALRGARAASLPGPGCRAGAGVWRWYPVVQGGRARAVEKAV
jgi:hypothetical protein